MKRESERRIEGSEQLVKFLEGFGHLIQPGIHPRECGSGIKCSVAIANAGTDTGEQFNSLLDSSDRPNVKFLASDSIEDIFTQHQVLNIGRRNHHALGSGQAFDAAHIEEAFNFFVYPANRLHVALLVHGTGDGNVLPQRKICQSRYQRVYLGGTGAIAIHAGIRLFKTNTGSKRERFILSEVAAEETRDDVHALVVEAAAQIRFAFDVDEARF